MFQCFRKIAFLLGDKSKICSWVFRMFFKKIFIKIYGLNVVCGVIVGIRPVIRIEDHVMSTFFVRIKKKGVFSKFRSKLFIFFNSF